MEHPLHSGDYAYALLDDGTVEITSYGGADTEIVIPDTLDGKPVTAIGERAFYYSLSLTSSPSPIPSPASAKGRFPAVIT